MDDTAKARFGEELVAEINRPGKTCEELRCFAARPDRRSKMDSRMQKLLPPAAGSFVSERIKKHSQFRKSPVFPRPAAMNRCRNAETKFVKELILSPCGRTLQAPHFNSQDKQKAFINAGFPIHAN